jgi:Protein of unknown function (DUF3078)
MRKFTFLGLFLIFGFTGAMAQKLEKPVLKNMEDSLKYGWWTKRTQLGANLSGSGFSQSWQGGGVNNLGMGAVFNNKVMHFKGKGVFTNDIQLQLGFLNNMPKVNGVVEREFRKNIDRLFVDSKYAQKINPKLNWYAGVNLLSQFLKGFDNSKTTRPVISSLFAPAFLSEGLGLEYKASPHLLLSFGGATLRQTFVMNDVVFENTKKAGKNKAGKDTFFSYGVEQGKRMLFEAGFQGVAAYDRNLTKNINLKGRWQSFYAYAPVSKAIDHNVNVLLTAKVNKYINFNVGLIGIFDRDQISKADIDANKFNSTWQFNGGANLGFGIQL